MTDTAAETPQPAAGPARAGRAGARSRSPQVGNFHDRDWGFLVILDSALQPLGRVRVTAGERQSYERVREQLAEQVNQIRV